MTANRPTPEETGILEFLSICNSVYSDDAVSQSIEAQRAQYARCARFSPPIPAGLTSLIVRSGPCRQGATGHGM